MSLPRLELSTQLSDRLNVLSAILKARTRNNLNDASHTLEYIVARLFNVLFGWNLENLNTKKANYPGIDLADHKRRIAMQVTNNGSPNKIKGTIDKVTRHGLNAKYSELIVFFLLPQKPAFPKSVTPTKKGLQVETLDIPDLVRKVSGGSLECLQAAVEVLSEEVPVFDLPAKKTALDEGAPIRPTLIAKFQEENGKLCPLTKGKCPAFWMDLWIEGAPPATRKIKVKILFDNFIDNPWKVERKKKAARDFLTDDMNSYGDVAILVRGFDKEQVTLWTIESTLHQALLRYYDVRQNNGIIKSALDQIRDN